VEATSTFIVAQSTIAPEVSTSQVSTSLNNVETTFEQSPSQTPFATAASICGDGITSWDEGCDDGNTVPYDGCDSNCRVERLWKCVIDSRTSKSTCTLIAPPDFSDVQISANTSYTAANCEYRITVLANFYFEVAVKVSIQGLPLITNELEVNITGTGVGSLASWNQTSNTLVVDVTVPDQNYLFFTIASLSPPAPISSITLELACSMCIADLPGRPVPFFTKTLLLAFENLPPQVCAGSSFGPDCAYTCYGTIVGDKCLCSKGQFGFQCDQVATRNELLSSPPRLVDPTVSTEITSPSGIGVIFPAGALGEGLTVTVDVYELQNLDVGTQAGVIIPAGPIVVFEPSGIQFDKPVTIFTPYNPSRIPAGKQPFIFYNNELAFPPWERQESEIVSGKNLTSAAVFHFSGYMTMGAELPVIPSPAPNATAFITVTSTPLPAAENKRSNIRLILGLIGGGVGVLITISASLSAYRFTRKKRLATLEETANEQMPEMADVGLASATLVLKESREGERGSHDLASEQTASHGQGAMPRSQTAAQSQEDQAEEPSEPERSRYATRESVSASLMLQRSPPIDEEIQSVSAGDVTVVERSRVSSPSNEMSSEFEFGDLFSFRFPRQPLEGLRFVSDLAFAKEELVVTPRRVDDEETASSAGSTTREVRSIVL